MSESGEPGVADQSQAGAISIRVSSDSLPERDRVAYFCDFFAKKILRIDVEPLAGCPFFADLTLTTLPGLCIVSARNSPIRSGRSTLHDGDDGIVLQIAGSKIAYRQLGREGIIQPAQSIAFSNADLGDVEFAQPGAFISVFLPRREFAPLLRDPGGIFARPLQRDAPGLSLLRGYLELLRDEIATATPELQLLIATHIRDLAALLLGATRDAAAAAAGRGIGAARLHIIKKDIVSRLERHVSLDELAGRYQISPRYIRMLFEAEGTTFTEFVRDKRLWRAHTMLVSRRYDHLRISDIAYDSGFSDLSYFNRMFRRRFGHSPGEIRERSMGDA